MSEVGCQKSEIRCQKSVLSSVVCPLSSVICPFHVKTCPECNRRIGHCRNLVRGHFDRSDAQHRRAEKSGFRYRPEKAATVLSAYPNNPSSFVILRRSRRIWPTKSPDTSGFRPVLEQSEGMTGESKSRCIGIRIGS